MAYKPKMKIAKTPETLPPGPGPAVQQPVAQPAPIPQAVPPVQQAQVSEPIWNVQEMVTETAPVIVNSKTQEKLDVLAGITKILNTLEGLGVVE